MSQWALEWHVDGRKHGLAVDDEQTGPPIELSESFAAAALVAEMRENPYTAWCRARGCGHLAHRHDGDTCDVPGCECEGLKL